MAHAHTHQSADTHARADDGAENNENKDPEREPDSLLGEKRWGRGGGGARYS